MSNASEGSELKQDVTETTKEGKPKKELTPQEIQKRKKMLVYPLFFLIFIGAMWLILAPSGDKSEQQPDGFNPELPIPKDEVIVGDKRTAYEQEAMQNKQNEKMRSLQDFAFLLGEEEEKKARVNPESQVTGTDHQNNYKYGGGSRNASTIQSSAQAYQDVNRQLGAWYEEPVGKADDQAKLETELRIQELEKQLAEKSAADQQLELIEKSYAIAAKYMPNAQGGVSPDGQQVQAADNAVSMKEKIIPKPVSQVHHSVVSLLAAPIGNGEFLEQYGKPRNTGFITAAGNETVSDKNSIRACVYQTVTLTTGKEVQIRLLEPMQAGDILIPANTVITGACRIGGERLEVAIGSIQYEGSIIPVELLVYDMDGQRGIFIPGNEEVNAAKEVASTLANSAGTSIMISDDAGSQLTADVGKGLIQGASQYVSKKMSVVKVTLKAGYKVLLLPKV